MTGFMRDEARAVPTDERLRREGGEINICITVLIRYLSEGKGVSPYVKTLSFENKKGLGEGGPSFRLEGILYVGGKLQISCIVYVGKYTRNRKKKS